MIKRKFFLFIPIITLTLMNINISKTDANEIFYETNTDDMKIEDLNGQENFFIEENTNIEIESNLYEELSESLEILEISPFAAMNGAGTVSNPYQVSTVEHLRLIDTYLSANYKLVNDIDLNNVNFNPIGKTEWDGFKGTFDGNGYTIKNLKGSLDNQGTSFGLFTSLSSATVKNLTIENINVIISNRYVYFGGIAADSKKSTIENCHVKNVNAKAIIYNDVSSDNYRIAILGGLFGSIEAGSIKNCSGNNIVLDTTNTFETSTVYMGGLFGRLRSSINELTGIITYIKAEDCKVNGVKITNSINSGGIAGYIFTDTFNKFSAENVDISSTLTGYHGGLVGISSKTSINQCFATGKINGKGLTGGIAGEISKGKLNEVYASVNTKGTGTVGAMVGLLDGSTVEKSYFDSVVAGMTIPTAQARTTSQMKTKNNFIDWDFNKNWDIKEGQTYPYFRTEIAGESNSYSLDFTTIYGMNSIAFGVKNLKTFKNAEFTIIYKPQLVLVDLVAQTFPLENTIGIIKDSDIEIISLSPGIIKFKINKEIISTEEFTGTIVVVNFSSGGGSKTIVDFETIIK